MDASRSVRVAARIVAAACAAALLAACAATKPAGRSSAAAGAEPPPARLVPTRPPPDLGVVERFAWQTVEQLAAALAAGDAEAFLARVSRGFYRGYASLEEALASLLASGGTRTVVVAVSEVRIEEERVSVRARWTHDVAAGGRRPAASAGDTTFLFLKTETTLRLLDFRGDPPFGIPGI